MKTNRFLTLTRLAFFLFMAGLLVGCGPIIPLTGRGVPTQPAPAATTGGAAPSVKVSDQNYDGSNVVVAEVVSDGPGWLVIHSQQNGVIGPAIGFTALKSGINDNVKVRIDPKQATPVLYAMLHTDAGKVGTYEFPGPDAPVFANGEMISPSFKAAVQGDTQAQVTPAVILKSQQVQNGKVLVQEVDSNGPGWLAIHVQNPDGTPGNEIGYTAVKAGKNTNVTVIVDPTKMTKVLYAMLHSDAGEVGMYEFPGPDAPVTTNGMMVGQAFSSDGSVLAQQMPMMGAAEGSGTASPQAQATSTGLAMAMPTAAATTAPTNTTAPTAAVAAAPSATASGGMGMAMSTPKPGVNPGVKVSDQPLSNGMVKVDDVVSSGPGWIVIYTLNASGQPDQPIGHAAVKDGDNKNVMVPVDAAKATGTLYAQLHTDAGAVGTFEYPGPDAPVMIGVTMISGQFKIQSGQAQAAQPTAAPANVTPSVTVADQPIVNSSVVVPQVVANGDSWLVIHPVNGDGSVGPGIGDAELHDGVNTNVVVHVDTTRTSSTMQAMLHQNVAHLSAPDFPGQDQPVMVNGQMVAQNFKVTLAGNGDVILNVGHDANNGAYLVDGRSMTLYLSLGDQRGKSNCTGDCLNTFQPMFATGKIITGPGVDPKLIGVIVRPDNSRQVTYAGQPLYYYVKDQKAGDMNGMGLNGTWFTVNP